MLSPHIRHRAVPHLYRYRDTLSLYCQFHQTFPHPSLTASNMKPPMFLPLLLLTTCTAAGNADIREHDIYGAVGSSVTFPEVNITDKTPFDLRTIHGKLIVTYHGSENVRPPYDQRANFYTRNGTFVLKNLTQDDSGIYVQWVNMKVVAHIRLHVIEPAKEPTLSNEIEISHGSQCQVKLECNVPGADPRNVTFLKDGEEITENIIRRNHSSYLPIDPWDPGSPGTYTCTLWTPLGVKTSSEITLPKPDNNTCKNATSHLQNWTIVLIIIIIITILIASIAVCFVLYKKYIKNNGKKSNHDRGDVESGDTTPESTSQPESPLLYKNPFQQERKGEFSKVSMNDQEEPGENMTLDNSLGVHTADEIPESPDQGPCGQEGTSTMEVKVHGMAKG